MTQSTPLAQIRQMPNHLASPAIPGLRPISPLAHWHKKTFCRVPMPIDRRFALQSPPSQAFAIGTNHNSHCRESAMGVFQLNDAKSTEDSALSSQPHLPDDSDARQECLVAVYSPLEMRRRRLGRAKKTSIKVMNICSSLPLKMMIHCPYGLSHAINLGSQRIPSSDFRLRRPTEGGTPPPYLYCVYTLADLSGQHGVFQDAMAPARMQTKIIPTTPGILSVSARKLCLLSEKNFSLSDNGQCRTMRKRKANNRFANCCSLANRQSTGIQRKMIRTNRGGGLESNARAPT